MTYPQQPGQGDGPQPGGQSGEAQPNAAGQPSPYPQQSGSQQGFAQPGGQQPNPQHPGWNHQLGGFEEPAKKKNKTGLIVGIVAAAVVVVGGGAAGVIYAASGGSGGETQASGPAGGGNSGSAGSGGGDSGASDQELASQAAHEYVDLSTATMRSKGSQFDETKAGQVLCPAALDAAHKQRDMLTRAKQQHPDPNDPYWKGIDTFSYKVDKVEVSGTKGTLNMSMVSGGKNLKSGKIGLTKDAGHWQVCTPK